MVRLDIRPDNVLLVPTEAGQRVVVVDWELAGIAGAHYEAPEQLRGLASDGRADIYTLGLVAYEMLTGAPAFSGASAFAIAIKHLHELPSPITWTRPDVPGALDALVRAMLAKDPSSRPWLQSVRLQLAALTNDDEAPLIEIELDGGFAPFIALPWARTTAGEIANPPHGTRSR